ncbi:MAG: glycosyltransferase [Bryobacteraceae bacterium]
MPARHPRILHAIESLNPAFGGTVESVLQLATALEKHGVKNAIVTLDGPRERWRQDAISEDAIWRLGPPHLFYRYCPRLSSWLKDNLNRFDVILVHGLWRHHNAAVWWAAQKQPVPRYILTHSMLNRWFNRDDRWKHLRKTLFWWAIEYRTLRDAEAVVFSSEQERSDATGSFWPCRGRQVTVAMGTADSAPDSTTFGSFLRDHPETRDKTLLLFLGRLHPMKGCDLLIDAFATVARNHSTAHLVMAGPDTQGWRADLESRACSAGLQDRITFPGPLYGDAKWSALAAADLFVLPSHCESASYSTMEALACSAPVLITNKVNSHTRLLNRPCAIITDDTVDSVAQGLDRFLAANPGQAARDDARAAFLEHFHIDRTAEGFLDLFRADLGWRI